jgi:large subunit ribosomal protein L23
MSHDVIIKPIVTEKSMQAGGGNTFTFLVANAASKTDIKNAIKANFGVNVVSVSTSKIKGKRKRIGQRRVEVVESATKKAVILLKKGEKISLFESGTSEESGKKKSKK